jgi:hypothetical protein
MSASDQIVLSFLADHAVAAPRRLKIAMTLAESMVRELKASLSEWETTVENLQAVQRANATEVN